MSTIAPWSRLVRSAGGKAGTLMTRGTGRKAVLEEFAQGLWALDGDPISFLGFPYTLRMSIARLGDGSLFLHSPVQPTARNLETINTLGRVSVIVTPNKLHHLFLADWAKAFPEARLFAAPGLIKKRPDIAFAAELGDIPDPVWADTFLHRVIGGSFFMKEVLFFHRASATLILGDLIENHNLDIFSGWQRMIARVNRMVAPHGETPVNYRLSFFDRKKARQGIRQVMAWKPRQVIVMHGPCITRDAQGFLERAFAWLL